LRLPDLLDFTGEHNPMSYPPKRLFQALRKQDNAPEDRFAPSCPIIPRDTMTLMIFVITCQETGL
jgi:hypothetical protein